MKVNPTRHVCFYVNDIRLAAVLKKNLFAIDEMLFSLSDNNCYEIILELVNPEENYFVQTTLTFFSEREKSFFDQASAAN